MKKALRETQTLHAGCSIKAEPKKFAQPQTTFPGAQDRQNLISWRWSLPSVTDPVWWRSMHAISSYRSNRPTKTNKPTHKQTGPITIHCAAKLSAQCNQTCVMFGALLEWRLVTHFMPTLSIVLWATPSKAI